MQELNSLKDWFSRYVISFYSDDETDNRNISLKEEHSLRVMDKMDRLARSIGLDEGFTVVARTIGLLHDLGRFSQYRDYKTFLDPLSVNHAAEGVRVSRRHALFEELPAADRAVIIRTIALHNVFSMPARNTENELLFLKMIRDADKLDIWRVFIHCYSLPEADRPTAACLGCVESDEYSPQVLGLLRKRGNIRYTMLRTLNDFRLLKLSWVYHMNFSESLRIAVSEGYFEGIAALLPQDPEIDTAIREVRDYLRSRTG